VVVAVCKKLLRWSGARVSKNRRRSPATHGYTPIYLHIPILGRHITSTAKLPIAPSPSPKAAATASTCTRPRRSCSIVDWSRDGKAVHACLLAAAFVLTPPASKLRCSLPVRLANAPGAFCYWPSLYVKRV
jgi:hypothetical protein